MGDYSPLHAQLRYNYPFLADDLHRILAEIERLIDRIGALSTFRFYIEYMAMTRGDRYRPRNDLRRIEAEVERVNSRLNALSALRDHMVFMRTHWNPHARQQHPIILGVPGETVQNWGTRGEMETSTRRRVIEDCGSSGVSRHVGRGEADEGASRLWPESSRRESHGFPVARNLRITGPAIWGIPRPPLPFQAIPRGPRLPVRGIPRT